MTNEKEKLAREWAESKLAMPTGHLDADVIAAAEHIMATTKEPTMDEVEWNEEKHALTGAVVDVGSGPVDVVMLAGSVDGIDYATLDGKFGYEPRYYFTPNGKRYELVEVTYKPNHPETLFTQRGYADAPVGTIVDIDGTVAVREELGWFSIGEEEECNSWFMSRLGEGEVVRWGRDTDGDPCETTVSSNENVGADQPKHPETLTTWEDFDNAPEGTVVSSPGAVPAMKNRDGRWRAVGITTPLTSGSLALGAESSATVLRWGWGE